MSEGGGEGGGGEENIMDVVAGKVSAEENPFQNPAVIAADWVGFLSLGGATIFLLMKLMTFKGPEGNDAFFMGYREEKMLCVYVNMFAAVAYWARLASHANGDTGSAAYIHVFKYGDYLLTCPMLTLDLMWSLNLPYKLTYAMFVAVCITCALGCQVFDAPARYMWFGLGMTVFAYTWTSIMLLTRMRLAQLVSRKAKQVRGTLSMALGIYFGIWCSFPTLWLLKELKVINEPISLCMHAVVDVLSKSVYGFALLHFQIRGEEMEFVFLPLHPKVEIEESESESDVEYGHRKRDKSPVPIGSKEQRKSSVSNSRYSAERVDNPFNSFTGGAMPPANNDEMADTVKQIQALNSQLNTIMGSASPRGRAM
eukprot:CAMPEP_0206226566 /NCGR_PEP_ID=MMETSP0047_2-20121206/8165_1 /ASSEMBLY_ACC=CAM_ASM_000192 /TAXON_ID=195065 /ORGANISM="Chroomonas mesostigmatica_cf, Strain CCMP1168" /LENGTH=367 /DNA_ID=CAMNT_0053649673 /DNA_START=377 /DNA_END=1480 /DNA_ORIENTATION=+